MTAFNCEQQIQDTISSVQNQDYADFEIIIVDDGSTDSTGNICRKIAENDQRIKYICQANAGPSAARNHGLRESNGEYILFVDADDYLQKSALRDFHNFLTQHEDAEIIFANSIIKSADTNYRCDALNSDRSLYYAPKDLIPLVSCCLEGQGFNRGHDTLRLSGSVWAKAYNSQFLKQNNLLFNTNLPRSQDIEFNIRCLLASHCIGYLKKTVYTYNVIEGSHSHRYNPKLLADYNQFINAVNKDISPLDSSLVNNDFAIFILNLAIQASIRSCKDPTWENRTRILRLCFNNGMFIWARKNAHIRNILRFKENIKILLFKIKLFSLITLLMR
ncbi:glycosyltransferase family 2 protein [Bifidobacterium magnum]|uniref:glycosyltransferase family 2 protein n=1 Tax=Bifidobacterium magnum TaxID=1692 RepID=UPI001362AEC0|nr:glycosyltransferase [Bifidobacterium magnum]